MKTITNGAAGYRTKLLPEARAERFAACLRGNARFTAVTVQVSSQAKNWYNRHFVSYLPAAEERQGELRDAQQDKRAEKAATEGREYLFVLDTDSLQPFCWCQSTSGEVYEVTLFDCSCPDFRYRMRGIGCQCKHMLSLSAAMERGEVKSWKEIAAAVTQPEPAPRGADHSHLWA